MKTNSKNNIVGSVLHHLQHDKALRHKPVLTPGFDPQLALLRRWQSERLAHTYTDLLTDRRYRSACLFFLSDIYAPRDFSQRDYDMERIHAFLSKIMPPSMLQLLTDVVELNSLTNELDRQLVQVLVSQLGANSKITPELYTEGYRRCDNYSQRVHQIDLISHVVAQVGEGAHLKIVGVTLKLGHAPAYRAGWIELYDFLERGYKAFKQMRDVGYFVQQVEQREMRILNQIFAGHPDPFAG